MTVVNLTPEQTSDSDLIREVAAGNAEAQAELRKRHPGLLFGADLAPKKAATVRLKSDTPKVS